MTVTNVLISFRQALVVTVTDEQFEMVQYSRLGVSKMTDPNTLSLTVVVLILYGGGHAASNGAENLTYK